MNEKLKVFLGLLVFQVPTILAFTAVVISSVKYKTRKLW